MTSLIIFIATSPEDYSHQEENAVTRGVYMLLFMIEKLRAKGLTAVRKWWTINAEELLEFRLQLEETKEAG